jgi:hypothetical protein
MSSAVTDRDPEPLAAPGRLAAGMRRSARPVGRKA